MSPIFNVIGFLFMVVISVPMSKEKNKDIQRKNKIFIEKNQFNNFDSFDYRNNSIY